LKPRFEPIVFDVIGYACAGVIHYCAHRIAPFEKKIKYRELITNNMRYTRGDAGKPHISLAAKF
jgi:hypothetical protein